MNEILKLLISLSFCFLALCLGGLFTSSNLDVFYSTLNKLELSVPYWVYDLIWTIMCIFIAISLFIVWRIPKMPKTRKRAMELFWMQLIFNVLWSLFFFEMRSPKTAFIDLILLLIIVLIIIVKFYRISRLAAFLLLPYIMWVSFIAGLNFLMLI